MNETQFQSTYSQPTYTTNSSIYPTRTIEVAAQGKISTTYDVLDTSNSTVLYTIKSSYLLKPHLTFISPSDNQEVATVSFHNLSTKIDITIRGRTSTIKPKWRLKESYEYTSPTSGTQRTWKSEKLISSSMVCLDEKELALARWQVPKWSWTKLGRLEIVGDAVGGGETFEELIVTGMAVLIFRMRIAGVTAASGAGAASSAAAASV
ncbi:hypothetical protein PMZ80_008345 [Knufia obscura]|uniref:Uncharacterized protein n=2 Tax=Knufia TaxID=430999 RepID=A0AAN8I626_9EURO|nr:hypothetical protein PMZ80_008345 [Knufia obscura]KAK5951230.1 hypothetical protein OHC33_007648 [Knufia fluminis]